MVSHDDGASIRVDIESSSSRVTSHSKGETVLVGDYRVDTPYMVTVDVTVVDVFESILDV